MPEASWESSASSASKDERPPAGKKKKGGKSKKKSVDFFHAAGDNEAGWKLQVAEEEKADKASHRRDGPNRQSARIKRTDSEKELKIKDDLDEGTLGVQTKRAQAAKERREEVKKRQEEERKAAGLEPRERKNSKEDKKDKKDKKDNKDKADKEGEGGKKDEAGAKADAKANTSDKEESSAKSEAEEGAQDDEATGAAAATAPAQGEGSADAGPSSESTLQGAAADDGFFGEVKGKGAAGDVMHAGRLRLTVPGEPAYHDAYCVLLSSLQLLCMDLRSGRFDAEKGTAVNAKAIALDGAELALALQEDLPAFELRTGDATWRGAPLGYYNVEDQVTAAVSWHQLTQALLSGKWPPGDSDDEDEEHDP